MAYPEMTPKGKSLKEKEKNTPSTMPGKKNPPGGIVQQEFFKNEWNAGMNWSKDAQKYVKKEDELVGWSLAYLATSRNRSSPFLVGVIMRMPGVMGGGPMLSRFQPLLLGFSFPLRARAAALSAPRRFARSEPDASGEATCVAGWSG